MSDVIERLPICPFCEMLGHEPHAYGTSLVADLPACNECAERIGKWSDKAREGLLATMDAIIFLRDRGYTVTDIAGLWKVATSSNVEYLTDAELVQRAQFLRDVERIGNTSIGVEQQLQDLHDSVENLGKRAQQKAREEQS